MFVSVRTKYANNLVNTYFSIGQYIRGAGGAGPTNTNILLKSTQ